MSNETNNPYATLYVDRSKWEPRTPGDDEFDRKYGYARDPDKHYRDADYVRCHVNSLARQAAAVSP